MVNGISSLLTVYLRVCLLVMLVRGLAKPGETLLIHGGTGGVSLFWYTVNSGLTEHMCITVNSVDMNIDASFYSAQHVLH